MAVTIADGPYAGMDSSVYEMMMSKLQAPGSTPPPGGFDLLNPDWLKGLLSTDEYDFLLGDKVAGGGIGIDGIAKGFSDLYSLPIQASDKYFQDYLGILNTPTSADQAIKSVEQEGLEQLLAEIDRDTKSKVASTRMDMFDRGIAGPGRMSDIEANAIAQLETGGGRTKAGARTGVLLSELERKAEREKLKAGAYADRYKTSSDLSGKLLTDMISKLIPSADVAANITGTKELKYADIASQEKRDFFDNFLEAILKGKELSQQDQQFYKKLAYDENQAALERDLKSHIAAMQDDVGSGGFMDSLSQGLGIASKITSLGKDMFGGVQIPSGLAGRAGGLF